jgi:hypothetical protein
VCRGFMLTQWGRWYDWEVNGTAHASTHFTGVQGDTGVAPCTGGVMVLVGIDACHHKLMGVSYPPAYPEPGDWQARELLAQGTCAASPPRPSGGRSLIHARAQEKGPSCRQPRQSRGGCGKAAAGGEAASRTAEPYLGESRKPRE